MVLLIANPDVSAFPFISEILLNGVSDYLKVYGFIMLVFPLYFELSVGSLFFLS